MNYSLSEYAEMHYYYGVAQGNGREAASLYREQLQRRGGRQPDRYPDHRVFINTYNTLMAGRIPGRHGAGEGIPTADPDCSERVVEEVQRDCATSTRRMTRRLGIPRVSIQRILKGEGYHPYHIQPPRSPDLNPIDFFIWGYYKENAYARESNNEEELRRKIEETGNIIRSNREAFRHLKHNFFRRCRLCISVGGRQFENLL
jgi:hypothetical protein